MEFLDAYQRCVALPQVPRRIISLVPSITETVFALGAGERVVGVTSYCTHPPDGVADVMRVGGTKDPELDTIERLEPDLIIVNDEENRQEDFSALEKRGLPLYVTAPRTVAEGIRLVEQLGPLIGCQAQARTLARSLWQQYEESTARLKAGERLRVFCPIWRKPWMSFNRETYSDDMLWRCGGENIFRAKDERYFSLSLDEVVAADPHLILLPSEPYPFAEKHFVHLSPLQETAAGRGGHFYCVDGMALCWYGPRIAHGLTELSRLFAFVRETMDE